MNALTRDLADLVKIVEAKADGKDCFRQKLHLMPPTGWLNDPNGLCQFHGVYHAFFQYSPFNANGGLKMWGHYTSADMITWNYEGVSLYPDRSSSCSYFLPSTSCYTVILSLILLYRPSLIPLICISSSVFWNLPFSSR